MVLTPGARLGPYEILAAIGAGGMGEVYRARDTRLGRDVAIKVLPEAVANDPERLSRFEREAKAVAALSHPNILSLHDFDRVDGTVYAVMELLEGETLRTRLQSGAMPVRKAVDTGVQIARALAAAHDKGLVHRDLKPENVFLLSDGQVKVLDFGLARATPQESAVTQTAGTDPGVVLGTVGYMSPEQVRGQIADPRTDLFAFGAVLYEMLSGQRAFRRETTAETMTAILRDEPPELGGSRPEISPALDRIVRHCLEKNPAERFQTARDVAFALEALSGSNTSAARAVLAESSSHWRRTSIAIAVVAGAILLAGTAWWWLRPRPPAASALRLVVDIGADASLVARSPSWNRSPAAILSPDGNTLAFVARTEAGRSELYVRRLDQLRATALPDTEDAVNPFFSPEGDWIGFFVGNELKKVSVGGGAPISLTRLDANVTGVRGAWWSEDGTIVFQSSGTSALLQRVAAAGGVARPVGASDAQSATIRWPQVLPGGAILYTAHKTLTNFDGADLVVRAKPEGPPRVALSGAYFGRYVASGHLLFMREARLMAAAFDIDRLQVVGPVVPVVDGIETSPGNAGAQFSVSSNGTLAYVAGASTFGTEGAMQWLDETGRITTLRTSALPWGGPQFSPDGRRLAMMLTDGKQFHVWIYDWVRDTLDRLAFDAENDRAPVWSPTGGGVMFAAGSNVVSDLYWRRADRTGSVERLTTTQRGLQPWSWHPSGRFVLATENAVPGESRQNIKILAMDGGDAQGWKVTGETLFTEGTSDLAAAAFSRDGQWIAYATGDDAGRSQVFVRPFQREGGPWQVSTQGGRFPIWSPTRSELLFAGPSDQIMRASYSTQGGSFQLVNQPTLWASTPFRPIGVGRPIDLHPDGQRFVIKPAAIDEPGSRISNVVLVFNFFDELRRVARPN